MRISTENVLCWLPQLLTSKLTGSSLWKLQFFHNKNRFLMGCTWKDFRNYWVNDGLKAVAITLYVIANGFLFGYYFYGKQFLSLHLRDCFDHKTCKISLSHTLCHFYKAWNGIILSIYFLCNLKYNIIQPVLFHTDP
jgi:hypothetical protein